MKRIEIEDFIRDYLKDKLDSLQIDARELTRNFDFVQSGLLDSMAFVDMVSAMENYFNVEIDFENEVDNSGFTSMRGVSEIFLKADEK